MQAEFETWALASRDTDTRSPELAEPLAAETSLLLEVNFEVQHR